MPEEHRCQTPEGHRLCANNCGVFGSSATMNLCSKCYRDFRLKGEQQASTKSTIEADLSASSSSPNESVLVYQVPPPALTSMVAAEDLRTLAVASRGSESEAAEATTANQPNRCSVCRKRVGLTGFRCRCGTTLCGSHRNPEKHNCTFDFKTVGRDEIDRANPLVKADKVERI